MTQDDTKDTEGKGNTKLSPRSRAYCFTLNNYNSNIFDTLTQLFSKECQFIFGKEKGSKDTPHIQGYIKYKNARSFNSIKKKIPKAHIEKAKGTLKQNYDYCSKEKNFITNIDFRSKIQIIKDDVLKEEYTDVVWKPWQQQIIDDLKIKADSRKILWYWEEIGNIGKSYLVKYLALTQDVIIAEGKKDNIFNQINNLYIKGIQPRLIILDIPRSSLDYINYSAIEQIKNGCIYSGKYEGGQCIFNRPHIIIFANEPPKKREMSIDKWDIRELNKDEMQGPPLRDALHEIPTATEPPLWVESSFNGAVATNILRKSSRKNNIE